MICPNCSYSNPGGAGFCGKCGDKLSAAPAFSEPQAAGDAAAAATAAKRQVSKPRYFCGKCGRELRADGTCLNCAAIPPKVRDGSRLRRGEIAAVTPVPLPSVSGRTVGLIAGAIALVCLLFYGGKALWGDSMLVRTNVPGATILVDGAEKGHMPPDGATPLEISHLHGKLHTIVVQADGYVDASRDVTFPNRMTASLQLNLYPKPILLHVQALPGSAVLLNNGLAGYVDGSGTWTYRGLQAAHYSIAVRHNGNQEWTSSFDVKPGQEQSLTATQPEAELTPEQKAAKAQVLYNSANSKFLNREYLAAKDDCDAAGAIGVDNPAGTDLCRQIGAAISALGINK